MCLEFSLLPLIVKIMEMPMIWGQGCHPNEIILYLNVFKFCRHDLAKMKYEVLFASGRPFDVNLAARGLLTELNALRTPIYSAGCKAFDLSSGTWQVNAYIYVLHSAKKWENTQCLQALISLCVYLYKILFCS